MVEYISALYHTKGTTYERAFVKNRTKEGITDGICRSHSPHVTTIKRSRIEPRHDWTSCSRRSYRRHPAVEVHLRRSVRPFQMGRCRASIYPSPTKKESMIALLISVSMARHLKLNKGSNLTDLFICEFFYLFFRQVELFEQLDLHVAKSHRRLELRLFWIVRLTE